MKKSTNVRKTAFTLIELLVVVAMMAILASLLLPSLARAKQQAWKAVCLSNLHQVGASIKLYIDEHQDRFPSQWVNDLEQDGSAKLKCAQTAMGGVDPRHPPCLAAYPRATARPLYEYARHSEVYRCPADRGQAVRAGCGEHAIKATNFEIVGCSYHYNAGIQSGFRGNGTLSPQADWQNGLSGKREWWAPDPARYILMYEPPSRRSFCGFDSNSAYCQWHFSRGQSDFSDPRMAGGKFYSPVLHVDGHTAFYDFTRSLCDNPNFPFEPTKDWMWYKPAND